MSKRLKDLLILDINMPKTAINYETQEISFYRFVCEDPNIVNTYVGSTSNFAKRKQQHKQSCLHDTSKAHNFKIYQTIRESGGWDAWKMVEIESRLVKNKRDAEKIEQEWIEKFNADMNSHKAFGGNNSQEYFKNYAIENCDKIRERKKHYRTAHLNEIKQSELEYRKRNSDYIKDYKKKNYYKNHEENLERQAQYRLLNQEKINKQIKKYYDENPEKLREKSKNYASKHSEHIKEYKKEYAIKNAEKLKEYKKQYYLKKKAEKINEII